MNGTAHVAMPLTTPTHKINAGGSYEYGARTRAWGISVLSLLTNMSLQSALRRVGMCASVSCMASAAPTPRLLPLNLRVVMSVHASIAFTMSATKRKTSGYDVLVQ